MTCELYLRSNLTDTIYEFRHVASHSWWHRATNRETDYASSFNSLARFGVESGSYLHSQCHFYEISVRLYGRLAWIDRETDANCEIGACTTDTH
jgi:hypothetical protein